VDVDADGWGCWRCMTPLLTSDRKKFFGCSKGNYAKISEKDYICIVLKFTANMSEAVEPPNSLAQNGTKFTCRQVKRNRKRKEPFKIERQHKKKCVRLKELLSFFGNRPLSHPGRNFK